MSDFLEEYLGAGFSQIVVIDYSHKEKSSVPWRLAPSDL